MIFILILMIFIHSFMKKQTTKLHDINLSK